jgi:hypothetical protein
MYMDFFLFDREAAVARAAGRASTYRVSAGAAIGECSLHPGDVSLEGKL